MSKKITITLYFDEDLDKAFSKEFAQYDDYRILSKSLDARKAPRGNRPQYHYQLEVVKKGETFSHYNEEVTPVDSHQVSKIRPIIVGLGPAGLFAALRLLEYGVPSLIIERGSPANLRMKDIAKFWRYGHLNEESNVCFGEGGAGLFSDGKLITRIKSPFIQYVMNKLVEFGAPEHIAYESNPHLGSNRMRRLISSISAYLKSKDCEIHYNCRVNQFLFSDGQLQGVKTACSKHFSGSDIILATGHSAKDIYTLLENNNISLEAKDFALGVRVEHPRDLINKIQYGKFPSKQLGAARYRLSHHDKKNDRGCFSFCMCPGGYVLSSSTEKNGIVVNGMSNFHHNSKWSNSALVVSVKSGIDFSTETDTSKCSVVQNALNFQKEIEHRAFIESSNNATGRELPAVRMVDFLKGGQSKSLPRSSTPSGVFPSRLENIFPNFVLEQLQESLIKFDKKMNGFVSLDALLIAPETRTSSCVRICRDKHNLNSREYSNLYPCGEGAGFAGGITSSAVDGVKVANALIDKYRI